MKFLKSISTINSYLVLIFLLLLGFGCAKNKYPNPTDEYYVNDFASAIHPYTKQVIVHETESLYENTKDISSIGGAQIVFATFLVDSVEEIASYNKTDIFRQWEIGKNDMGVLVLMFYTLGTEDGIDYIYLEETQFEVGYRMEQYLTAGELGRLLDETIYSDTYDDLDMKIIYLYYEILETIYVEAYPDEYGTYSYDLDAFQIAKDEYVYEEEPINYGLIAWILFYLTGSSNIGWYWIIPIAIIAFGGGVIAKKNRGGGGSSGGYGIFRRR